MENSIYRFKMPKALAVIYHLLLFIPLMMSGSVYLALNEDMVGARQIWSEDFMFISLCMLIGFGSVACLWMRIVTVRRHRLVWLVGLSLLMLLTFLSMKSDDVWQLALYSMLLGGVRMTMHITNLAATARVAGVEMRVMLGPKGDGRTTAQWDAGSLGKSMIVPMIIAVLMTLAQVGQWIIAAFAQSHPWRDAYLLVMTILAIAMLLVGIVEGHRGRDEEDESATPILNTPSAPDGCCPYFALKYLAPLTSTCLTWASFCYVFLYGKTLDWYHSPQIWIATMLFFAGLVMCLLVDRGKPLEDRYFILEVFKYPSSWLAAVLMVVSMVLSSSSTLTSVLAGIGLNMDTYTNNMLGNWCIPGYFIGGITCLVLRKKGVHYRWIAVTSLLIYAWIMWFTYNQAQPMARYEDMRLLTIVRNAAVVMFSGCLIAYGMQRLPMRLFPSWILIVMITRVIIAPSVGAALFGSGLQHYQMEFIHSLAAKSDNVMTVFSNSMQLSVKYMSGQLIWFCLALAVVLAIIPWPKRKLKPEEIPDEGTVAQNI